MRARWAVPFSLLSLVLAVAVVCPGTEEPSEEPRADTASASAARVAELEDVFTTGEAALSITGRVVGPNGAAISGAEVALAASAEEPEFDTPCPHCGESLIACSAAASFEHVHSAWTRRPLEPLRTTRTSQDGSFRFDGLKRVSFAVWAQAAGFGEGVRERAAPGEPLEIRLTPPRLLSGRVVAEDGSPVAGASITARSRIPVRYTALSDASGAFSIPVGDGPFYLVADAEGYVAGGENRVSAGGRPVTLTLSRERTLDVLVLRDGKPVEAQLRIVGEHLALARSAEDGFARVSGLPPEKVSVYASAGNLAATAWVQLREPATRVELVLGAGGTVAVTVVDASGQPVPDPTVRLALQEQGVAEVKAKTGERVVLGPVPSGAYSLSVSAEGFEAQELPVEIDGGERALDVVLEQGAIIRGRVVDEYGRPASGVIVNVSPAGDGMTTGPDGRFTLSLPMPGIYELNAHHSDWGGTDAKVSAPAEGVELHLLPKAGLRAQVTADGKPLEGALLVMQDGDSVFFSDRASGADGVAVMRGLPPGDFLVRATHPDHLPSQFQRLKLEEGQTTEASFQLSPGARIRGRVVDDAGRGVAGAAVLVSPQSAEPVVTSADGRFDLGPVRPDGRYRLAASHPDYEVAAMLAHANGAELEVVLRAKQRFTGRVVGRGGAPVTRFSVDRMEFSTADGRFDALLEVTEEVVSVQVQAPGFVSEVFTRPAKPDLGTFELEPSPRLSGRIVDGSGAPVSEAHVDCAGCEAGTLSDADGRFTLTLPGEGEFEVSARKGIQAGQATGRSRGSVTVRIENGTTVAVRLFDDHGNPAVGEGIEVTDQRMGSSRILVTGQDGVATVSLAPSQYRFSFTERGPELLQRVDEATREIVLGPAPGTGSIQVLLGGYGPMAWVVPGTVTAAVSEKDLARMPLAHVAQHVRNQVVFRGLPPGDYTVVVFPSTRQPDPPKIAHVTVTAGQVVANLR